MPDWEACNETPEIAACILRAHVRGPRRKSHCSVQQVHISCHGSHARGVACRSCDSSTVIEGNGFALNSGTQQGALGDSGGRDCLTAVEAASWGAIKVLLR